MLGLSDTAGAINELPDIGVPETISATGTMDATADPPRIFPSSQYTKQCNSVRLQANKPELSTIARKTLTTWNIRDLATPSNLTRRQTRKRAKGLEPSTFSLEGYQHRMEVPHEQGPTGGSANACTNACTGDTYSSKTEAAENATHNPTHRLHQTAAIAPNLQRVIDVWPALPTAVRHGLLTIIDAVGGHPDEARR